MTTITINRATVEQALEALEFANANHWWGSLTIEKAITALRAALAQQAEPVGKPEGEQPAGVVVGFTDEGRAIVDHDGLEEGWVLYTAPPQQAEPVGAAGLFTLAHLWAQQCYFKGLGRPCDIESARGAFEQALKAYTAPPQRKPLTDEEIDRATAQARDALLDHIYEYGTAAEGVLERIRKLCRAVERAHDIPKP